MFHYEYVCFILFKELDLTPKWIKTRPTIWFIWPFYNCYSVLFWIELHLLSRPQMAQDPQWIKNGKNSTKRNSAYKMRVVEQLLQRLILKISAFEANHNIDFFFLQILDHWAQQRHSAINIPNTQQGIFKYNFQLLCLHGFTWPGKPSQPLMICLAFILFSIYLILRVKWRVNETKI